MAMNGGDPHEPICAPQWLIEGASPSRIAGNFGERSGKTL
jgi:hypothetical protein